MLDVRSFLDELKRRKVVRTAVDEEPRMFFMHFRANDDAVTLARGLRAALDATNVKAPEQ